MQELLTAYNRFMKLMDSATDAFDRTDLGEAGLLEERLDASTLEMKAQFVSAIGISTTPEEIVELKRLLQQALNRVTQNQTELAGWIAGTGMQLGRLQQGARAVHSYEPSTPSRQPSFEQKV